MRLLAGTSGFSYKAWKGPFYPEDLAEREMLAFYARRFPSVEINNTFYRLPKAELLRGWAAEVPDDFLFVLKASRRITHVARLRAKEGEPLVAHLCQVTEELGGRRGAILFQLPPNLRKDTERLRDFVALLPPDCRAAFEFRHDSWFVAEVYDVLGQANAALCIADTDKGPDPELVVTADWGYLRLRRDHYSQAQVEAWAERIAAQRWRLAYAFFKHEDQGVAPRLAAQLTGAFARLHSPR